MTADINVLVPVWALATEEVSLPKVFGEGRSSWPEHGQLPYSSPCDRKLSTLQSAKERFLSRAIAELEPPVRIGVASVLTPKCLEV